jgi:branched-chain amino acid aminotransferase
MPDNGTPDKLYHKNAQHYNLRQVLFCKERLMPHRSLPYHDRDGFIWYDGEMVPWRQANLHVLSHGLHYASAVFEGERVYGGSIFKLTEHSQRLVDSGRILGFEIPFSVDEIDRACEATIRANGIIDGYVRPIAWRGSEMMGVSAQQSRIHLAIATWAWGKYYTEDALKAGIRMKTATWRRPPPESAPVHAKATGLYMICTLSKHSVEDQGYNDALMLDWRGLIAEATGANIFLAMPDGRLHSPTPDCFLDGITRRTVIGLARARGIEVVERAIRPEELAQAREVFLTGTAAEITPVGQIDDFVFHPGEITRVLTADYRAATGQIAAEPTAAKLASAG